jgi:Asp-tRNA(Asn)/Glu-tRNA(Gln) amidotransferase B subunit
VLSSEEIERIQSTVPNLPHFYRESWKVVGFDPTVVNALLASRVAAELIQRVLEKKGPAAAKRVGFWLLMKNATINQISAGITLSTGEQEVSAEDSLVDSSVVNERITTISDEYYIELSDMVESGELSATAAKDVASEMQNSTNDPRTIATEKNLIQVSDEGEILSVVDEVLSDISSQKAVDDLKNGNEKVIGFLVGQVMKKSGGKANPSLVRELIRKRLK